MGGVVGAMSLIALGVVGIGPLMVTETAMLRSDHPISRTGTDRIARWHAGGKESS